jgi:uncharacterized membrane protein YGL010W
MKTAKAYFDEYAQSHQNGTNQKIHYICVPIIFFNVIGLLMCIPTTLLASTFKLYNPLLENWAIVATILVSVFYLKLGFWYFMEMIFVILICIVGNFWISNYTNLLYVSIGLFVLAWIGQFYGHKVEGAKPSFLKDLEFLLIGPLWIIQKIGKKETN